MSHHDPDRLTPWTRDQLWAADDAQSQRTHGLLLTAILVGAWTFAVMANYPFSPASTTAHGAHVVSPPGMRCHVSSHRAVQERMQLLRSASPEPLCVTRSAR